MSTVSSFFFTAGFIRRALCELARYALGFGWAMLLPKARLAARVLAAERQLAIELSRSGGRKHRRQFTAAFRLLWVALSKLLVSSLEMLSGHSCGSWLSPEGAVQAHPCRLHGWLTRARRRALAGDDTRARPGTQPRPPR